MLDKNQVLSMMPNKIVRTRDMKSELTRRDFLVFAGATITAASKSSPGRAEQAVKTRPNIIFIFIDDMGYTDLSCYGNKEITTPNIDRLATEGIRFTQAYVNSPICSPSRVAVTTGMYPSRWRISSYISSRQDNKNRETADFLDPKAPSLARTLKKSGYATAHFGKWHMGGGRDVDNAPHPKAYGFDQSLVSFEGLGDRILPPSGLSRRSEKLGQGNIQHVKKHEMTQIYVNKTIDFMRKNKDKPFYINLWLNDVHDSHQPKPEQLEKYRAFAQNPYKQKFYAVLDELDRQIGRLMNQLKQLGLDEQTLILCLSDNGPTDWPKYYEKGFDPPGSVGPLYGRKWSLYEGGIRVPFIVRWMGKIPQGIVDEKSVLCGIDLFRSVCTLAGADVPKDVTFDGEDASAAFLGKGYKRKKPIFWDYGRNEFFLRPGNPDFISPNLAVREGKWKLLINDDGSDAKLYDLDTDIGEKTNLAKKHPDITHRLSKMVLNWRKSLP
jgi:arylsulfatase A-like enzyme